MPDRHRRINRRKFDLKARLVFVTKHGKRLLFGTVDETLKDSITRMAEERGWDIAAMETSADHIHLLPSYDTTEGACDIAKALKQQTTADPWARHGSWLAKKYWRRRIFWSDGHFACSIGEVSEATIRLYIENQG